MRRDVARRRFRGRELAVVSAQARAALGDDAVVLRTSTVRVGQTSMIEIVAASGSDVERFRARLTPGPMPGVAPSTSSFRANARNPDAQTGDGSSLPSHRGSSRSLGVTGEDAAAPRSRPLVIALVGPTGAGKTTTAVKIALHADALGGRKVGFVTLDTYRAGAVAQLETYAGVAGIPFEVVYETRDVAPALARLADCDVVIVDTPGRGPKSAGDDEWRALLDAFAPDEVHLVMPGTVRADVAEAVRDAMELGGARIAPTHALLTKLDEVPGELGVAELAARLDLPVRWVADGQAIPTDLAAGVPRLLEALGTGAELAAPAGATHGGAAYPEAWS
jgi:flagellar biosynthesis protein FlhF